MLSGPEYKGYQYEPIDENVPLIVSPLAQSYSALNDEEEEKTIKIYKKQGIVPDAGDNIDDKILSFLTLPERAQTSKVSRTFHRSVENSRVRSRDFDATAEQKTFKVSYGQINQALYLENEARKALLKVAKIDKEIVERNARAIRLSESNPKANRQNAMQAFILVGLACLFYWAATSDAANEHCHGVGGFENAPDYTVCDHAPSLSIGGRLAILFGLLMAAAAVFKIPCFSSGSQQIADLAATEWDRLLPSEQTLEEKRELASNDHEELRLAANLQPLDTELQNRFFSRRRDQIQQAQASRSRCVIL